MTQAGTEPVEVQNYIGGIWCPSAGDETLPIQDPASAEILGHVPLSTASDVHAAVAAAAEAFPAWRATPAVERARILFRLKALLDDT